MNERPLDDEKIEVFIKELHGLLVKHEIGKFEGKLLSGLQSTDIYEEYQLYWNWGRYGADKRHIKVAYKKHYIAHIGETK